MKKLFILFFCLTFSTMSMLADPVQVKSFADLKSAIDKNSSAEIQLIADIDMSSLDGKSDLVFKGKLTGKDGSTIHCFKNGKTEIFKELDGAVVEDIRICNFSVSENENVGTLAWTANNAHLKTIWVESCTVKGEWSDTGGLVGEATNTEFRYINIMGCTLKSDSKNLGGIVGRASSCQFYGCITDAQTCIFCDGEDKLGISVWPNCYTGGIVGFIEKGGRIEFCWNYGFVAGDGRYIGGIVGYIDKAEHDAGYRPDMGYETYLEGCRNAGMVANLDEEYFDQIVPDYRAQKYFSNTPIAFGDKVFKVPAVHPTANDKAEGDEDFGGIVGHAEKTHFYRCTNMAPVICNRNNRVGGIAGYADDGTLETCCTTQSAIDPFANSENYHGGLVGHAEYIDRLESCLSANGCRCIGSHNNGGSIVEHTFVAKYNFTNSPNLTSYETYVTNEMLENGVACYLMNHKGYKDNNDWYQKIAANAKDGDIITTCPVPYASLEEIKREQLLDLNRITTPQQLKDFMEDWYFGRNPGVLTIDADLDMTGNEWMPIGTEINPFIGIVEGNGHTIDNLKLPEFMQNVSYQYPYSGFGLFGVVGPNTYISNITLGENSEIITRGQGAAGFVGAVIGDELYGDVKISGCMNKAKIQGAYNVAGILGYVRKKDTNELRLTIENCANMGQLTATEKQSTNTCESAAICAYTGVNAKIKGCWTTGSLVSTANCPAYLPGEYFANLDGDSKIEYCATPEDFCEGANQNGVTRISEEELAKGKMTFLVNGNTNDCGKGLTWEQLVYDGSVYHEDELGRFPVYGNKGVYIRRSRLGQDYATVCLPYAVKSNEEFQFYRFIGAVETDNKICLKFEAAEKIEAGEPALLKGVDNKDASDPSFYYHEYLSAGNTIVDEPKTIENQNPDSEWKMVGTFSKLEYSGIYAEIDTRYIYFVKWSQLHNAQDVTINPYHAFFLGPNVGFIAGSDGTPAKTIVLSLDDEDGTTTALEFVGNDLVPVQNGKTYNIMGTEVGDGYKGIVIKNGKKILSR